MEFIIKLVILDSFFLTISQGNPLLESGSHYFPSPSYLHPPPFKVPYETIPRQNIPHKNYDNFLPQGQHPSFPEKVTIHKHVSIHVAPEDPPESFLETKVIRPHPFTKRVKHLNIIFVKAPSVSRQQQTEVVLPEQPEQKTLVYILVKKPERIEDRIKIREPIPTSPPSPQVFFIRYKHRNYEAEIDTTHYNNYKPSIIDPNNDFDGSQEGYEDSHLGSDYSDSLIPPPPPPEIPESDKNPENSYERY